MTSAFKNFFITFVICLLLFGFLGFKFAMPFLTDLFDFSDMGNQSTTSDVSEEVSEEVSESSTPVIIEDEYDENGDIFTAVIFCVDSNNRPINTVFIDSNGKSKQFIYCPIPNTVKAPNEIGTIMPVGDLFTTLSPEGVVQSVSALTGIETKYCLKFTRDDLVAIASVIPGASFVLNEDIMFVNPAYADYVPVVGVPYPDDYYISISNVDGKVLLNEELSGKTKIEWLLEYNPNPESEYNSIYSAISKALIKQFFEQKGSTMSSSVMAKVLGVCETNLTLDEAGDLLPTIFAYDEFNRHELIYPSNWETAVVKLRELDNPYKK